MNKSKVVLIVEDEKFLRDIVCGHLDSLGLEIIQAENGAEALELVREQKFDLIISDIQMPIKNGIELLRDIRALDARSPPFVFTTAFNDISSEEALALGAEAFLRKPLARRDLIEVVQKALISKDERWAQSQVKTEGARSFDFTTAYAWNPNDSDAGSIEIGQGGMFLPLYDDFPSGFEVLRFKVDSGLKDLGEIEGYGQVRWVRKVPDEEHCVGIGLEFLELENASRLSLLRYLETESPRAYIPLGLSAQRMG